MTFNSKIAEATKLILDVPIIYTISRISTKAEGAEVIYYLWPVEYSLNSRLSGSLSQPSQKLLPLAVQTKRLLCSPCPYPLQPPPVSQRAYVVCDEARAHWNSTRLRFKSQHSHFLKGMWGAGQVLSRQRHFLTLGIQKMKPG